MTRRPSALLRSFCIVCNYVSRIIGPIASRCAKFRFCPLSREVMTSRLTDIGTKEGFDLDPSVSAPHLLSRAALGGIAKRGRR